jgi:hypothetical protein
MSKDSPRNGDANTQAVNDLSKLARPKGIGNVDFGSMHKIEVVVSPSLICKAYSVELYDAMLQSVILANGNPSAVLPFTESDLNVYLMILLRERIKDVRKQRVLFPRSDQDVKIPHFYYLMLYELGDVVDEQRHIWLEATFDGSALDKLYEQREAIYEQIGDRVVPNVEKLAAWNSEFKVFAGERDEREFIYAMSRSLKMLERYGFVNGSALPRGLSGDMSFMLFVWAEGKLQHPDPNVEPGQALLASLLAFSRSTTLLNPYISYGPENAYRILLKEVTLPRGKAS